MGNDSTAKRNILHRASYIETLERRSLLASTFEMPEVDPFPNETLINWTYWDWTYVSYILVAPLQEFIARGVFQNTVARLIMSKRAAFWSILVTAVLFGTLHLHTSMVLGIAAFTTSWLWGWMFARQRSLIFTLYDR